jgi:hypothetical protein
LHRRYAWPLYRIKIMSDFLTESGWTPRFYYSHYHLQAAALFARRSSKLEKEHGSNNVVPSDVFSEHRAYVTGAILSAVSFLEAEINEIFADSADDQREHIHQLGDVIFLLSRMWSLGVPKTASYSILDKYQIALALADKQEFDKGASPYQDVRLLIKLRNALVHYEPEYTARDSSGSKRLEQNLQRRFPLNPLTGSRTPFFPERCMSHGCAKWAVESSITFVDDFCSRMGLKPVFDGVRPSLGTE